MSDQGTDIVAGDVRKPAKSKHVYKRKSSTNLI